MTTRNSTKIIIITKSINAKLYYQQKIMIPSYSIACNMLLEGSHEVTLGHFSKY